MNIEDRLTPQELVELARARRIDRRNAEAKANTHSRAPYSGGGSLPQSPVTSLLNCPGDIDRRGPFRRKRHVQRA